MLRLKVALCVSHRTRSKPSYRDLNVSAALSREICFQRVFGLLEQTQNIRSLCVTSCLFTCGRQPPGSVAAHSNCHATTPTRWKQQIEPPSPHGDWSFRANRGYPLTALDCPQRVRDTSAGNTPAAATSRTGRSMLCFHSVFVLCTRPYCYNAIGSSRCVLQ